jgi:hypothetical protein
MAAGAVTAGDVVHEQFIPAEDPLEQLLYGRARCVEFCGEQVCSTHLLGTDVPMRVTQSPISWYPSGKQSGAAQSTDHLCYLSTQVTVDAPRRHKVFLPGSFNPLHEGNRCLHVPTTALGVVPVANHIAGC